MERGGAFPQDEAPLQLTAVQLSHCVWDLHAWGPRGSDPTAGEVTAADPVPFPQVVVAVLTTLGLFAAASLSSPPLTQRTLLSLPS